MNSGLKLFKREVIDTNLIIKVLHSNTRDSSNAGLSLSFGIFSTCPLAGNSDEVKYASILAFLWSNYIEEIKIIICVFVHFASKRNLLDNSL